MSDPCITWDCGHEPSSHDPDEGCQDCAQEGRECFHYSSEPSEAQLEAMAVGWSSRERVLQAYREKRMLHG